MHNSFYTIPCTPRTNVNANMVREIVPGNLATTEMAHRILPMIVATYVNICTNSAITPPRIAYLNTAAQNNWINNETYAAYSDVLDMLRVMAAENRISQPTDGIQGAVETVIIFRISLMCAQDPNILQYIDQGVVNEMQQRAHEYANFRQSVLHYRQITEQNRFAQSYSKMDLTAAFQGGSVSKGMFTSDVPGQTGSVAAPDGDTSHMSHYERRAMEARKRAQEEAEASAINYGLPTVGMSYNPPTAAAVETVEAIQWKPSNEQHYVELYRPQSQEYEVTLVNVPKGTIGVDGKNTNVVPYFVINEKENPVDREKHITLNTALVNRGMMSEMPNHYKNRNEAVTETLKAIAVDITTKPEDRDPEVIEFLKNNLRKSNFNSPSVFSLQEAITQCWLYHKAEAGPDFTATAFMQEFSLVTNFSSIGKHVEDVRRILTKDMPLTVADSILKAVSDTSTPRELRGILANIDRLITISINDLLLNKLSLDVSIESFTEDFDDLLPHIRNNYAEIYYESFTAGVIRILHGQMKVVENHDMMFISVNNGQPDEEGFAERIRVNAFGFKNSLTVTTMDILSAELDFGFYKQGNYEMPGRIMESNHSIIYWYAKSLFENEHPYIAKNARHLLVTADNCVYELHRGLIGNDNFLISQLTVN